MRVFTTALMVVGLSQAQSKSRDLSAYDVIGPFNLPIRSGDDSPEQGRIRAFLWDHWRQQRRGVVRVRHQWVEGISDVTYFVEPDSRGRWAITQSSGGSERSCNLIERVEPDRLRVPIIPIPDDESRKPEKYLLHPKCWKDDPNARLW